MPSEVTTIKNDNITLTGVTQVGRLLVRFPVRAHTWPGLRVCPQLGRVHKEMFLTLSFSLLSPLSKNK